jgi:[acyl-carrier-protein] S-malonyltransferase
VQNGDSLRSVMKGQMAGSVRWIETIGNQWNDGVRRWVELGPKNILGKMLQPILTQCGAADGEWSTSTASTREETGTL